MAINIEIKNLNMAIDKGVQEAFLNLVANIQTIIPYYCYNDKIYNYIKNFKFYQLRNYHSDQGLTEPRSISQITSSASKEIAK